MTMIRCRSARWYSGSLRPEEAMAFLSRNRGKRYDPAAVDAFLKLISETQKTGITEVPLRTMHLKPGMVLTAATCRIAMAIMLLAKGSVLTGEIIGQLVKLEQSEQHTLTLYIRQEEK
jgi:hypothetical protein